MEKKIVFIGRAAVGKTSIKKVLFDGLNPEDLLIYPVTPTRGIETNIYPWMDLEIGFVDTSGQELPSLLQDETEQGLVFSKASAVVYVMDYLQWLTQPQEIIDEINLLCDIIYEFNTEVKFNIFFHKLDLIRGKMNTFFEQLKTDVLKQIGLDIDIGLFFTSLYPNLLHNTYFAISEILGSFSEESKELKNIVDLFLKDFPKALVFITNQDNTIVTQSISKGFDIKMIHFLQNFVIKFNKSVTNMIDIYKEVFLVDPGPKFVDIIIDDLSVYNAKLKNIVLIAEEFNKKKLILTLDKIQQEISRYYSHFQEIVE